ncbi:mitochondrial 54S ribosomal protein YmL8 [Apiospora marii]|uniref:Mitochondrial 54S ribosomal protein YmL8 n=1 Tax=Apiospora marii TaxID=335849 RepID=A0ABR1T4M7_9PEZI
MAGGVVKYRHLSRNSAHRQALLRNLVTSLVKHESIRTTWAKAKETQRMADKLITLAKRNNETSRRKAHGILFTPDDLMPKLFTTLRERYEARPGGYTRVLRTEPKSTYDQAPSAILEFVDGPKDMRFHLTAARVAKDHLLGQRPNKLTLLNRKKVTQFRGASAGRAAPTGKQEFNDMVERMKGLKMVTSGVDMLSAAATTRAGGAAASKGLEKST